MRLRLAAVSELQFLRCLQHGVWGSGRRSGLKRWEEGDMIALAVKRHIAALAKVKGRPFYSEKDVWDNGLFPERIRLEFVHVMDSGDRVPYDGAVGAILAASWGRTYGWGILNKQVLPKESADKIVRIVLAKPNSMETFKKRLASKIAIAKAEDTDALGE